MKKLIFTALVAVVAIGGAFAGKVNVGYGIFIVVSGTCTVATIIEPQCSPLYPGPPCQATDGTNTSDAYSFREDESPFSCLNVYKRLI